MGAFPTGEAFTFVTGRPADTSGCPHHRSRLLLRTHRETALPTRCQSSRTRWNKALALSSAASRSGRPWLSRTAPWCSAPVSASR